jgi:hypothetical protein
MVIAYENIAAELRSRPAALEATREFAYRTDTDDVVAARAEASHRCLEDLDFPVRRPL